MILKSKFVYKLFTMDMIGVIKSKSQKNFCHSGNHQCLIWKWEQNRQSFKQLYQNSSVVKHLQQGINVRYTCILQDHASPTMLNHLTSSEIYESIKSFQSVLY